MKTYNYDVYCNKNLSTFLTERVTAVCEDSIEIGKDTPGQRLKQKSFLPRV